MPGIILLEASNAENSFLDTVAQDTLRLSDQHGLEPGFFEVHTPRDPADAIQLLYDARKRTEDYLDSAARINLGGQTKWVEKGRNMDKSLLLRRKKSIDLFAFDPHLVWAHDGIEPPKTEADFTVDMVQSLCAFLWLVRDLSPVYSPNVLPVGNYKMDTDFSVLPSEKDCKGEVYPLLKARAEALLKVEANYK